MSLQLEEAQNRVVVHLEDSVTLSSASELHDLFLQALNSRKPIAVDVSKVTEIDLSAIQILFAAHAEAIRTDHGFSATNTIPEAVRQTIRESGLDSILQPDGEVAP